MSRLPAPLLLITDRAQARLPLLHVIEEAFEGGCKWLSLREKDLSPNERLALLDTVLPIAEKFGATISVHADVQAAARADGVHLPSGSDVSAARSILGTQSLIGLSCHTLDDVALGHAADYVTLGPFAPTASKPGRMPVLGMDDLQRAAKMGPPVLALGGVDETNLGALKEAGAAGFAVMGPVMRAHDPRQVVRRVIDAWNASTNYKSRIHS